MRRFIFLVAVAAVLAPTASASAATNSYVTKVRVGHHASFDRIVITFHGPVPKHAVRYVKTVRQDGSGKEIHLLGKAKLLITVHPTLATKSQPQGTVTPRFPEIRQVKGAGNYEGYTSYGVGLAAHEPFDVSTLGSPSRLVIDIQLPAGR
ncbi:MAG TPA: hypothetical protein VHE56_07475 [Mycobacteriales bacterium]|nr:hypothetical protein [Mycobacteriales bacterium]